MPFKDKQAEQLLVACHRRCCVCHRFCGVKMELDHMIPSAENGTDDIENAIPLCFECHAEVHAYNDKHPRGRKFQPRELQEHKRQWLEICATQPQALIVAPLNHGVGPLQALVDELDYNIALAPDKYGPPLCPFMTEQFRHAISTGSIAILEDTLRAALLSAYAEMNRANHALEGAVHIEHRPYRDANTMEAHNVMRSAKVKATVAREALLSFVRSS